MKIKKLGMFVLALIMVFTLAACGNNTPAPDENENNVGNENNNGVEDREENEEIDEDEEETVVTLYFANEEYIITGDEELDHVMPVERELELEEISIEEAIMEELRNEPEDDNLTTMLADIETLSVEVEENVAYVDLSSENLSGGSLQEALVLNQVVFSLTELEEIEAVQFLVDGDTQETLMGHITIDEPIQRTNN